MDILNFLYLKKQQLIKEVPNNPNTDLIILGAEVPFEKRGDGYETYAMALVDVVPLIYDKGLVTQITSDSTGVTINKHTGIITTVALTNAADAKITFTVTNSVVESTSHILTTLVYDEAATGIPVVTISDITTGSFKITISNTHSTAALNALAKVVFSIID